MLFAFWTDCLESNTSPTRQRRNSAWHRWNTLFPRWRDGLVSVAFLVAFAAVASAAETYDLTSGTKPGQSQAVRTAVEVKGNLKLNSDGKGTPPGLGRQSRDPESLLRGLRER